MLGIGWAEMLIIAVVALIVVGPKELPMLLRNVGKAMGTMRRMSNEFRRELDKAIAIDEIREAKRSISEPLKKTTDEITKEFNSLRNGKLEPSGKIKPSEPGKESVYDEIRAQAGMETPLPDAPPISDIGGTIEEQEAVVKAAAIPKVTVQDIAVPRDPVLVKKDADAQAEAAKLLTGTKPAISKIPETKALEPKTSETKETGDA